jgi:hypothetical protein
MIVANTTSVVETWATIVAVAVTAIAGDVLTAGAMRRIGDLDLIRAKSGMSYVHRERCRREVFSARKCRSSTLVRRNLRLCWCSTSYEIVTARYADTLMQRLGVITFF